MTTQWQSKCVSVEVGTLLSIVLQYLSCGSDQHQDPSLFCGLRGFRSPPSGRRIQVNDEYKMDEWKGVTHQPIIGIQGIPIMCSSGKCKKLVSQVFCTNLLGADSTGQCGGIRNPSLAPHHIDINSFSPTFMTLLSLFPILFPLTNVYCNFSYQGHYSCPLKHFSAFSLDCLRFILHSAVKMIFLCSKKIFSLCLQLF